MMNLLLSRGYALTMIAVGLAAMVLVPTGLTDGSVELVPFTVAEVALGFHVDLLSATLLAFVGAIGVVVATFAARNLTGQAQTDRLGWLLLTALAALTALVLSASLPVAAFGWTVSGMALAGMVAHPRTPAAIRAARFVRRRLLIGDLAIWLGVAAAIALLPTVNRAELSETALGGASATVVASLVLIGAVVRSALTPAQAWLPETAEAPSPVSAFLHAGIVNGAGVLAVLFWPLFLAAPAVLVALLVLGTASVVYGTLAARSRADVKGQLACSTTAQMGYMSVQLGLGLPIAALLHVIGHGFYKAWLFLRAGGAVTRSRQAPAPASPSYPGSTAAGSRTADSTAADSVAAGPAGSGWAGSGWAGSGRAGSGRTVSGLAVSGLVVAGVAGPLAWPAVTDSTAQLGPVAIVPILLAIATAAYAALSASRRTNVPHDSGPNEVRPAVLGPAQSGSAQSGSAQSGSASSGPAYLGPAFLGLALATGVAVATYAWMLHAAERTFAGALHPQPVWPDLVGLFLVFCLVVIAGGTIWMAGRFRAQPTSWWAVWLTRSALPPWSAGRSAGLAGTSTWPVAASATIQDPATSERVRTQILVAARLVGPAWPLRTMVAANPLAGLELLDFNEAAALSSRTLGTSGFLSASSYAQLHAEGRITRDHLLAAAHQLQSASSDGAGSISGAAAAPDAVVRDLLVHLPLDAEMMSHEPDRAALPTRRFTDLVDLARAERSSRHRMNLLGEQVDDHAAVWCQRAWASALDDSISPWRLWRGVASTRAYEVTMRARGLSGLVRELPEDPADALAWMFRRCEVPAELPVRYLCALLSSAPGWAAHAAWRARRSGNHDALVELAALRAALDLLIAGTAGSEVAPASFGQPTVDAGAQPAAVTGWEQRRRIWQTAYEHGFRQPLMEQLVPRAGMLADQRAERAALPQASIARNSVNSIAASPIAASQDSEWADQAPAPVAHVVFCIDVRSERLRRALEATGPYATWGFAGFFGAAVDYRDAHGANFEQLPALIGPALRAEPAQRSPFGVRATLRRATRAVSAAPVSPLLIAEAGGVFAGVAGVLQTFWPTRWRHLSRTWHATPNPWPGELALTSLDHAVPGSDSGPDSGPGCGRDSVPGSVSDVSTADRAALAASVLRAIGLVDNFGPLVVICAHGASIENNAFAAAYDCG
ncbi:MAG: putative inorganic carbon transporter subunit DabA, partial [Nocardioides sp.]